MTKTNDTRGAELVTRKHMQRVSELLGDAAVELIRRAKTHDLSKLTDTELGPLQDMQNIIDAEGQTPYGGEEYKRRTALLKPMLDHHYSNNPHHPEYYEDGVDGMDLFDVLEMVHDWKAASERGEESSISISASVERFGISDQLAQVIRNTADSAGWAHK